MTNLISRVGNLGEHTRFLSLDIKYISKDIEVGLTGWSSVEKNGFKYTFNVFIPQEIAVRRNYWPETLTDVDALGVWLPFGDNGIVFYVLQLNMWDNENAVQYNAVNTDSDYKIMGAAVLQPMGYAALSCANTKYAAYGYSFEMYETIPLQDNLLVKYEFIGVLKQDKIETVM